MARSDLKGVPVSPLTGVLDARSAPNEMPDNSLRMRQNLRTVGDGKLRRGNGWKKFLSQPVYNNQDYHDQLLTFTGGTRQPITLMFEAVSTRKVRSLFVATQSKIAQLNEFSGNYRIIGSGFGGASSTLASAPRFHCDQVGDVIAFTNDFEAPMYHELEHNAIDAPVLLKPFDDFAAIGLTRTGVVWAWRNCLFFADLEMDGERFSHRLIWSDFDNPISFDPGKTDSIAGRKDLYTHERIIAGKPSGNAFLIYTTHGIWEMSVVGGEESFGFRRVYNGEDNEGAAILKYPNTLVKLQDSHFYAAEDGLYFFSQYFGKPERAEWLHRASSLLYDQLNDANCNAHIAFICRNELFISVARNGAANDCPDITLRINVTYKVADLIDHGFTASCNYRSYRVPTIRDFILDNKICTIEELVAGGDGWVNEGLPFPIPDPTAAFTPTHFYAAAPLTIDGVTTEDYNQAEADPDSLCALLGNLRLDDICRQCEGATILAAACSMDWCIKQLDTETFYRERCVNPTAVGGTPGTVIDLSGTYNGSGVLAGVPFLVIGEQYRWTPGPNETHLFANNGSVNLTIAGTFTATSVSMEVDGVPGSPYTGRLERILTELDGYASSVGSYVLDGYDSIWRFAPLFSGDPMIQVDQFKLDYLAAAQTVPSQIGLRIGISAQPVDPNIGGCGLVWHQHSRKPLKCISAKTETQHIEQNTSPSEYHSWLVYREGRVLYFELKMSGTGGDAIFTGVIASVKQKEANNY